MSVLDTVTDITEMRFFLPESGRLLKTPADGPVNGRIRSM
jgi:hypothetical protein